MSANAVLRCRLSGDPRRRLQRHLRDFLYGGLDVVLLHHSVCVRAGRDPPSRVSPRVVGESNRDVRVSSRVAHAHRVCRVSRVLRTCGRLSLQQLRRTKLPYRGDRVLVGGVRRLWDGGFSVAC